MILDDKNKQMILGKASSMVKKYFPLNEGKLNVSLIFSNAKYILNVLDFLLIILKNIFMNVMKKRHVNTVRIDK